MKPPTSVIVLAVIGIVLSVLGVCGLGFSLFILFMPFGPPNPVIDQMRNDPLQMNVMIVGLAIGTPLLLLELVGSIASLRLRPWARKGMLVFAWLTIAQAVWGTLFNLLYVLPKMLAANHRPEVIGGMIGGIIGGLLGLIFPICILYFFTRPKVIDTFNGFNDGSASFPVEDNPYRPV